MKHSPLLWIATGIASAAIALVLVLSLGHYRISRNPGKSCKVEYSKDDGATWKQAGFTDLKHPGSVSCDDITIYSNGSLTWRVRPAK